MNVQIMNNIIAPVTKLTLIVLKNCIKDVNSSNFDVCTISSIYGLIWWSWLQTHYLYLDFESIFLQNILAYGFDTTIASVYDLGVSHV